MYCKLAELRPNITQAQAEAIVQKIAPALCIVAGAIMAPAHWQPDDAEATMRAAAAALDTAGLTLAAWTRGQAFALRPGVTEAQATATLSRVSRGIVFIGGLCVLPATVPLEYRRAWLDSARRALEDAAQLAK